MNVFMLTAIGDFIGGYKDFLAMTHTSGWGFYMTRGATIRRKSTRRRKAVRKAAGWKRH